MQRLLCKALNPSVARLRDGIALNTSSRENPMGIVTLRRLFPMIFALPAISLGQTPTIAANGVVNGATLVRSAAGLAPGSVVSIFGENLAAGASAAAGLPLPTVLNGVSVTFDGIPGAILYVSPRQINVQAPWSVLDRDQATKSVAVAVSRDGRASAPVNAEFARYAPGIFTTSGTGSGPAVALNADDGTLAVPSGAVAGVRGRPALTGSTISIYATGLGAVTPTAPAGHGSLDVSRRTTAMPEVLIGGRRAQVLYAGLAPRLPGVNQINVVVPELVQGGREASVQVRIGGALSPVGTTIGVDAATMIPPAMPGANAVDIWNYVARQNFRQNFFLIPGKSQLYDGIAPHTGLLTVYVNDIARDAIERKAGTMPPGSIVIKEAHNAERNLMASLMMYKLPGFDTPNNDWYWTTRRADGVIGGAAGSVMGCYACHARAAANDYIFLAPVAPLPQPNGVAVKDYLAKQNYKQTWRLWPGTTEMRPGAEPHGALVSIYVNETAFDAINNRTGKMPAGAMILKENYMPDKTLAALTVMYKSPGFNPAGGDWYWQQQLASGEIRAEGRVQGCATCHNTVAANDYLYTGSIETLPETRAATVWDYVQKQDYRKNWKLWPGTSAFTAGTEPHGALLTTYVNDAALDAITRKKGVMPPGAIVIKENYMPNRNLAAITLMYKSEGFDPEHNDWYWLQRLADGRVGAEGKVAGCYNCHARAASNDYLYLGPLK